MAARSEDEPVREPCPVCGRNFAPEALGRHQNVCAKTKKSRKVFDSATQRTLGDELTYKTIKQAQKQANPRTNKNWRNTHEQLISSLQNARDTQVAVKTGAPLPPPPPPAENPDYITCTTCNRRFNQKAALRHMPFCAEQNKRLTGFGSKPSTSKKAPTASRFDYKPPKPKTKTTYDGPSTGDYEISSKKPSPLRGAVGYTPPPSGGFRGSPVVRGVPPSGPSNRGFHNSNSEGRYGANNSANAKTRGRGVLQRVNSKVQTNGYHSPFSESPSPTNDIKKNGFKEIDPPPNPGSGHVFRTGKTPQMYEDARREVTVKPSSGLPRRQDSATRTPPGGFAPSPISRARQKPDPTETTSNFHTSPQKRTPSKFCHDCGYKFPVVTARFCCECGVKRLEVL